mgnify:CR=1 FL=1
MSSPYHPQRRAAVATETPSLSPAVPGVQHTHTHTTGWRNCLGNVISNGDLQYISTDGHLGRSSTITTIIDQHQPRCPPPSLSCSLHNTMAPSTQSSWRPTHRRRPAVLQQTEHGIVHEQSSCVFDSVVVNFVVVRSSLVRRSFVVRSSFVRRSSLLRRPLSIRKHAGDDCAPSHTHPHTHTLSRATHKRPTRLLRPPACDEEARTKAKMLQGVPA